MVFRFFSYFVVLPPPRRFVRSGLAVRFDRELPGVTDIAHTDLIPGRILYELPKDERRIIGVFINHK